MKLCVLGSGSSGNAVYVEAGRTRILFDAGFSALQIKKRLSAVGADLDSLSCIVISHEHNDHIAGLRVLGRKFPVYATRGTLAEIEGKYRLNGREAVQTGEWRRVGDLRFMAIPTSHDAAESVAYVVDDGSARFAVVTDLGMVTKAIVHSLADLDLAVIEANHDPDMLIDGPYPWEIKQRVKGRLGHLANHEAAELIAAIRGPSLKTVLLAHLSEINNRPGLALEAVRRRVDTSAINLMACQQGCPTKIITI